MPVISKGNPLFTSPASGLSPEQDALRWRALMERVQRIEQQLGLTVKYGPTGSARGGQEIQAQIFRASKILGSSTGLNSTVVDDFTIPLRTTYDSAGTPRVEQGNLAVRGSSPAQFGMRVNDAAANPIFDTIGLFGDRVMKSLGIGNGNNQSFTTTTFTAITNASVTFAIPANHPPANIFAPFVATGRVNTNNGNVGQVRANLVGVTTSGNLNFGVLANFAQTSTGWIFVTGLAAGTYTCQLEGNVNATPQTCDIFSNAVQVFQLGG
jgi:hypothetical protein